MQRAVDTQPDAPLVLARFDVDVGCAACRSFTQRISEQRNGRGAVRICHCFGWASG
jgi:hypothetical protein